MRERGLKLRSCTTEFNGFQEVIESGSGPRGWTFQIFSPSQFHVISCCQGESLRYVWRPCCLKLFPDVCVGRQSIERLSVSAGKQK